MSTKPAVAVLSVLVSLLAASGLQAQACLGTAPFSSGAVRLGAGAEFTDGAKSYGVQLAVGARQGPFASGGLSAIDYDDVDEGGTIVGLSAGYAIDVGAAKKAQFCPLVGFDRQTGPNIDTGVGMLELSARAFSVGGTIGGAIVTTPTMDFVPFVGAAFVSQKVTAEFSGSTDSASDEFTIISLGAGFVLNRQLTIRPLLNFPVGLEDGDPSYGIALAFNFGSAPTSSHRR